MKKVLLGLLILATTLVTLPMLFADSQKGTVIVHFKAWDGNYENLGNWGWGGFDSKSTYTGLDDFGAYFEFNDIAVGGENPMGFIAVRYKEGSPDWDNGKLTDDILIDPSVVKADETVHIYVFQGTQKSSEENPRYFVADNSKYNLLVVYFDPSGSYEENLGIHNWGGWTEEATTWNEPLKVFSTGGETTAGVAVKVAMLHANQNEGSVPDAGFLVYFGDGDNSKKTGDVKLRSAIGEEAELGTTGMAYIVSKGNGYTAGDNVFYGKDGYDQFVDEAFSFKLMPYKQNTNTGQGEGTFAVRPTNIIVKTSALVTNPYAAAETEADQTAALETVKGWFKLTVKGTSTVIPIERVDFALRNETISDFVIVLSDANKLDNTKSYILSFDNDSVDAEIELALDKEKPVISFPILGEDRIIEVAWGKEFDFNLFPLFEAVDDRDGNLTNRVYVPAGEKSKLNTAVEGDYEIMLRVEDTWGNVSEEIFIFRVTKNVK
ncbi:MAG TPA: hypothetical protein GYA04_02755 [Acholeplasma sp.]|nr:hypothetical protein [Acholeplasma sp.]